MYADADAADRRKKIVGANIRLARKANGFSQVRLAKLLGIEQQQISRWERGVWEPSSASLHRLATELERPLWWFYQEHHEVTAA